jgi:hypothetical protein
VKKQAKKQASAKACPLCQRLDVRITNHKGRWGVYWTALCCDGNHAVKAYGATRREVLLNWNRRTRRATDG